MIAPYRESGIILDIGTGDGRFVSASAKADPDRFYIGIDANAKPLEKLSIKITRKPAKGGLPNVMFVQAAVEDLPAELAGIADEININFPWGSLLGAVATGEASVLSSLARILKPKGTLKITIGIDPSRDRFELGRLDIPELELDHLAGGLARAYREVGFKMLDSRELSASEWSSLDTSWARRLGGNSDRRVLGLTFVQAEE